MYHFRGVCTFHRNYRQVYRRFKRTHLCFHIPEFTAFVHFEERRKAKCMVDIIPFSYTCYRTFKPHCSVPYHRVLITQLKSYGLCDCIYMTFNISYL